MTTLLVLTSMAVAAQTPDGPAQTMPAGSGSILVAKVKTVNRDSLLVSPVVGGDPVTVKIAENTRISKERQPAKLSDIKADQIVICRGEMADHSLHAISVNVPDPQVAQMLANPEVAQRMQQGGGRILLGPGMPGNSEDLGKKFIVGEVKAINETKLTISRPDGQTQDIEVDETTSFKKGSESITLPDIKAGDFVRGVGELKNGVFVPKELNVFRGQMRILRDGPGGPPQQTPAEKPAPTTPPKN